MRIHDARFLLSTLDPKQYPRDGKPELAFVGRSNVGKSTLLNALLRRKGLAKTSRTPGKTQTINFFLVNEAFYFVDLPGYGFAKVPKAMKDKWNRVMLDYLSKRPSLRLVTALVDSRHKPSSADVDMLDLLDEAEVPTLVVATKHDKLSATERGKALPCIRETLGLDEDALVVPVSAVTGAGMKDVWQVLAERLDA